MYLFGEFPQKQRVQKAQNVILLTKLCQRFPRLRAQVFQTNGKIWRLCKKNLPEKAYFNCFRYTFSQIILSKQQCLFWYTILCACLQRIVSSLVLTNQGVCRPYRGQKMWSFEVIGKFPLKLHWKKTEPPMIHHNIYLSPAVQLTKISIKPRRCKSQ